MNLVRRNFLRKLLFAKNKQDNTTLVCIFLRGGADTLNFVVPFGDDDYYRLRPTIHIAAPVKNKLESSVRLNDFYALHPKLSPLYPLFREGRLGMVQAVGSDNTSGSHFEAQDQMEHGSSEEKDLGSGWLGRHLRLHNDEHKKAISAVAMGTTIPECLRGAPNINVIQNLGDLKIQTASGNSKSAIDAIAKMYGNQANVLNQQGKDTLRLLEKIENLQKNNYTPENNAEYPQTKFGNELREVARIVKAQLGLQVACVDLDGWDTHFFQGQESGLQANNIDVLAKGLAAFDADLQSYRSSVTTIVMTEFGRRVYENSSMGTDHGRAFTFFALGDKINGGKVIGKWPGLDYDEEQQGPGGLKVQYDYRSVLSEILTGALHSPKIAQIFPGFKSQKVGLVN
ncbi:DUF1501 domain-containing protein [Candidatus Uabimicrobium sp. HlEnr_7]|uniref:DUF1501 domain-containing protein n=1 Tax=Candidatus Uabimicrobium helgolandensis TaxID=3095367 RepID=UPI00355737B0